ncbi:MAG: hypothetical protein M0018_10405 [Nitrospiraceae bacterium]|nr:hypothetical protein [Nitrospiraceae bacterium]
MSTSGAVNAKAILELAKLHNTNNPTLILPTVYASSIADMRTAMAACLEAMQASDLIGGINLEGPFLNPSRCGALDKKHFLAPSLGALKKLISGFEDAIKIITIAPELPGALKLIERCASMDIRVNMGHSGATYKEALAGKKAGATGITHIFNAMRPFHHREPGLAGFALLDEDVYVELIGDGAHVSPEAVRMVFRLKWPDKVILISDSVKGKTGSPVMKNGKLMGGGLTLSECAPLLLKIGICAEEIRKAAHDNPLRYLGIKS